jgi:hypothetical protein
MLSIWSFAVRVAVAFTVILACLSPGWSEDSSLLDYNRHSTSPSSPSYSRQSLPRDTRWNATPSRALTDSPAYHEENIFGYPIHQDPLYDDDPRPSWSPLIENKPIYDRPTYDVPDTDAPFFRQDPIQKPMYEKPLYEAPIYDRPKYDQLYDQAPAYMKPSYDSPEYRAPNYVDKAYTAPAYDRLPTVDQGSINYDRPEYNAPVWKPEEYRTPREVPPPYIGPAE